MTLVHRIDAAGCGCDIAVHPGAMIGIDDALARIARHVVPVAGHESVALAQAAGRVLAGAVAARAMTPPFDNAAMDGYAVRSGELCGDGPWCLRVAGRVPAGHAGTDVVPDGSALRIFTGAPVPDGFDAVVRQEDVQREGETVRFARRPAPGLNIRRAGSDMRAGQTVVARGAPLGPRALAACAAAGAEEVPVRRRLRVALLVTGDELRRNGAERGGAGIWDVNTPMLRAALAQPQVDLVGTVQAADSRAALRSCLAEMAATSDLIVTTGGVSVGEEDHVKPVLAALGAEVLFSGVAIKPGKPVSCGRLGGAVWLGLPGNPLSAFVTWHVFGRAVLAALAGADPRLPGRRHVVTAAEIRRTPGRCELRAARIVGFDGQGREVAACDDAVHSGQVARLPGADGLLLLPAETDQLPPGALVEFLPLCTD